MSAGRGQARDALCDMIRRFVRGETAPDEFPSQALLAAAREHQVSYPLFAVFSSDDPILGPARERIEAGARGAADHARWLQENLGASVPFVWLKGGAGLAENDFAPMPGRYMADLDILVSKEDVARATEALAALGYVAADTGYHEALHPHLPIFAAAGRGEGLEVHTRLLRFGEGGVLLPENLLARAETVSTSAGEARIPCRVDRIVHLIAHAQIQSHRFSRRTFLARDAIELFRLVGDDDDSLGEALARFRAAGHGPAAEGFVALAERILGNAFPCSEAPKAAATAWAEKVWQRGLPTEPERATIVREWLGRSFAMLASAEQRAALLAVLRDPVGQRHARTRIAHYFGK